jgi:hypothetical protein
MRTSVKPNLGISINALERETDLDYADDIALLASKTSPSLQEQLDNIATNCPKLGLRISVPKTKHLSNRWCSAEDDVLTLDGTDIEKVPHFVYLGSDTPGNGSCHLEIRRRLGIAAATFNKLNNVWRSSTFRLQTKLRLLNSNVLPVLLYGSECWSPTRSDLARCLAFENNCLRRILGVTWRDHVRNTTVREVTQQPPITNVIKKRRWRWLGHVLRMGYSENPRRILDFVPPGGHRNRGRPSLTIRRTFDNDLRLAGLSWDDVIKISQDRVEWRRLTVALCASGT